MNETLKPEGGIKFDQDKIRMDLFPFDALIAVAKVLDDGAKKYEPRNWEKGFPWMRIVSSALRHLFAWICGEDKDPETGHSHLAHLACNSLFLLTFSLRCVGIDDRPCVK